MKLPDLERAFNRQEGSLPIFSGQIHAQEWLEIPAAMAAAGGRLVSLWGSDRRWAEGHEAIYAAYATKSGLFWAELSLDPMAPSYLSIARHFPAASRMQRATHDLLGFTAVGDPDRRPWLRHSAWPAEYFPLRQADEGHSLPVPGADAYAFVPVEGEGVHEIAVGPVHAGIIEPGHFRFSVIGERVLRLEERLGYKHKGIEKRFCELSLEEGQKLAGRISGDTTCAYAWAYAMALEAIAHTPVPERAQWLRALILERERVANHLGDLGALGNDAAFGFGLAQFMRLKELWLRLNAELFGHRFMMDILCPGGVRVDLDPHALDRIRAQCDQIEAEVFRLKNIYDEHAGLQDRFVTLGRVSTELACQLGLTGLAGRASGIAIDLRSGYGWSPYNRIGFNIASHSAGDVAARVAVRFDEVFESLRLLRAFAEHLPQGPICATPVHLQQPGRGIGWVEGWRGEVLVALELDEYGHIRRCHCHDPSWQNWPVLEHAIIGDIVPDFPLINKSFNLSYSGQDL